MTVGFSVTDAAPALAVPRPALSNLANERAALSPDMALRIDFNIAQADTEPS